MIINFVKDRVKSIASGNGTEYRSLAFTYRQKVNNQQHNFYNIY